MVVTYQLAALEQDGYTRRALAELSLQVAKGKRVVVVTGAGVSCSSGVPDFRSSEGLYDLVNKRYPDVVMKGRDLFDASLFRDATMTAMFYSFIAELKMVIDQARPSPTHQFIKAINDRNRLLRSYTQNIDGLEAREGLLCTSSEAARTTGKRKGKLKIMEIKNVQLHGDIHRVRCMICSAHYACSPEFLEVFREGFAPKCPECVTRCADRIARSARQVRVGSLRPAIVLYDEIHPYGDEISDMCAADLRRKPDLLLVMGTSLKVHGIKTLVKAFANAVHAHADSSSPEHATSAGLVVFVNKTEPSAEWAGIIDVHVAGPSDEWVKKVMHDWKMNGPAHRSVRKALNSSVVDDVKSPTHNIIAKTTENVHAVQSIPVLNRTPPLRMTPDSVPPSPFQHLTNQEVNHGERLVGQGIDRPGGERGLLSSIMQTVWTLADPFVFCLLLASALLFLCY